MKSVEMLLRRVSGNNHLLSNYEFRLALQDATEDFYDLYAGLMNKTTHRGNLHYPDVSGELGYLVWAGKTTSSISHIIDIPKLIPIAHRLRMRLEFELSKNVLVLSQTVEDSQERVKVYGEGQEHYVRYEEPAATPQADPVGTAEGG